MLPGVNRTDEGYKCDRFFDFVIAEAKRPEVKRLVLSCAWQVYFFGPYPHEAEERSTLYRVADRAQSVLNPSELQDVLGELKNRIHDLKAMQKEVVVILPSPCSQVWNPRKVARWHSGSAFTPGHMSITRKDLEAHVEPLKTKLTEAVIAGGGRVIDPYDYFEEDGKFGGIHGDGRFRYRDHHHFRAFYVEERAHFIDEIMATGR